MPNSKKPLVVVTRKLPERVEARMQELFETRLNADDRPMSQAQLAEAMRSADVLVPTVTDRIDSRLLSQSGPRLKLIASFGTGANWQDGVSSRSVWNISLVMPISTL